MGSKVKGVDHGFGQEGHGLKPVPEATKPVTQETDRIHDQSPQSTQRLWRAAAAVISLPLAVEIEWSWPTRLASEPDAGRIDYGQLSPREVTMCVAR